MKKWMLLFAYMMMPVLLLAQVDYEEDIQPIFNANCISCHGGQNGVTLSSYDAVMESVGQQYQTHIVIPGEPENSPIVDKISNDNPQYGVRMPQDGPPYLSGAEIDLIVQWIEEGANEVPVSNEIITELPEGFRLNGNYPNPFNPATTIQFEVPSTVNYTLTIYNAVGVLINEFSGRVSAGSNELTIDFSAKPSGIYFYQLLQRLKAINI